ncbi:hypothetical protein C2G38_2173710 [Gigaspora rosea]|uniref:TLDc domain-containing protein n=1 Tax=Gigaspora rosea TaxID=44941 RepID=A0A397VL67_9GLOM|nr:hypothetical protein C2G38_2173710 [Gigaspora rosea]
MSLKILDQLSQDFTQLLENSYDYNVVIEVGKQPNIKLYKAHSAILYQRSYIFSYIYSGIVSLENFEAATIFDLLIALNEFQFIELVERIQSYLIDNYASWLRLKFSRIYQISFDNENFNALQQFCTGILAKHPSMIFNSDDFKTLQENAFIALLKQDDFKTLQENAFIALLKRDDLQMEESEIWDKVILWGKARTPDLPSNLEEWTDENFKSLKATLQHCLPHIRYFQIPSEDVLKKIKPYHNILEKNVWDDILAKYLAPNVPIASIILSPQHIAEISSWIDRRSKIYNTTEIPYEFKLLLRGSRDGFTGEVFHRLCDNIPGTVVVLKIDSTNEILGGYNPLIWKILNGEDVEFATTADSFIFSLNNGNQSILSRIKDKSKAIGYGKISQGPIFGLDLVMGCFINPISKVWGGSKYAYEKPIANINDGYVFFRDEYEAIRVDLNSYISSQIKSGCNPLQISIPSSASICVHQKGMVNYCLPDEISEAENIYWKGLGNNEYVSMTKSL